MRVTEHIPLRFLHSESANFTLPILKKPISTSLFPFSVKKLSVRIESHGSDKYQSK